MSNIKRLEDQIEELAASIRQSRKLMLAGQLSAALGILAFIVAALGSASISLVWLTIAVALTLGGLVLTGASKSSTDDLQQALMKAQTDRTQAIDGLRVAQRGT